MSKQIGRKFSVGLGKETVRGTAVAASFWIPKTDVAVDDRINFAVNDSSIGVIEDSIGQDITGKFSEISLGGLIYDKSFGLLLLATFGTETSQTLVETGVYDHLFNVTESAQHTSLTVAAVDPNGGTGLRYALAMVDQLTIEFEIGKYLTYKGDLRANANAAGANTASFTAENLFRPQDGTIKLASALAGLTGAAALPMKKGSITIKKNIEDDFIVGSVVATDRLNKEFSVEGVLELIYDDRVYIDTDLMADLPQAMRMTFQNTALLIGATKYPQIEIDMGKVKFQEVSRKIDNAGIIMQTVKFKAFYSIADSMMIKATLRNTQAAAY
jgi:Phage tail tube protein